jgi:hypothetical protein
MTKSNRFRKIVSLGNCYENVIRTDINEKKAFELY